MNGNPHIFHVVQALWPTLLVQRCLVHIQRQGLSWCRRTPKRTDAKHLRGLFLSLTDVHTPTQARRFVQRVHAWEQRFGPSIASSTDRGWVFSDLLRARSMLIKALPYMFSYLDDDNIPRSTNALEGYFSRLKQRYRQHRGLSKRNRSNYFSWYFYLCPR